MKPTLVTGATGFVGWHVARLLLERGHTVRALMRNPAQNLGLEAEKVRGDLRDAETLRQAAKGCGLIFHVAADYRLWSKDPSEMYRSNVDGTRNLLSAARECGVEKVVYTSTVGCIGMSGDHPGDESSPVDLEDMSGTYKRSKFLAEQVAIEFSRSGYPVVIVNPTAPIGDRDTKPTPTGKIIVDFLQGRMPAYVETGLNLVDVSDIAEGHWLAASKGRPGERYILGAQNLTLQQIFEQLEKISQVKAPRMKIPYGVAYGFGVVSTAWANLTGRPPRAPLDAVRMSKTHMWVTHDKARRELGFDPGSPYDALQRAVDWFRSNGYCR